APMVRGGSPRDYVPVVELIRDSPLKRHREFPLLGRAGLEAATGALREDTDLTLRLFDRDNGIRPANAAIDGEKGLSVQLPVLGQIGFHQEIGVGVRATHTKDLSLEGRDRSLQRHPGCLKARAFHEECPRWLTALGND